MPSRDGGDGSSHDVIVIGAGVIGATVAFELAKRGYSTLNVEKLGGAGLGSTGASCAIVRASYSTWDGVAMANESIYAWNDWANYVGDADEAGLARYVPCGSVTLEDANGHYDKVLGLYREVGVDHEEWDAAQILERLPFLNLRSYWPPSRPGDEGFWSASEQRIRRAIFTPKSGYVTDPQLSAHNVQRAAERLGALFRFRAEVAEILTSRGRVSGVRLTNGERLLAPVVVNVAGPHSFVLNRMAGVEDEMRIKTRALRHEVHHVPAPTGVDFETGGFHVSDGDSAIYFRPDAGNHILIGSEDPECDPKVWVGDPDRYDGHVTRAQWETQVYRLARRLPGLGIPNESSGIVSLYDVSDDWIPIYDRSSLDGFYMAVGTSGNQFKNAPIVGVMMAELIERCERGHDHDTDPVHVTAPYTGVRLNAGFYSRLRSINPESSFSVNG
jgi:sarcosine oxidase subunit beta